MWIALGSSVLIAAHISRAGVCAELLEDVLLHHELVISRFILEELGRKLVEKFNIPRRDADALELPCEDARAAHRSLISKSMRRSADGYHEKTYLEKSVI